MRISVLNYMFSYQIFIRSGGFHQPGMLSLWPITRTETNGLPPIRYRSYRNISKWYLPFCTFLLGEKNQWRDETEIPVRYSASRSELRYLVLRHDLFLLLLQTEIKTRYRKQCSRFAQFFLRIQILLSTTKKCIKTLISAVLWLLDNLLSLKSNVNVPTVSNK